MSNRAFIIVYGLIAFAALSFAGLWLLQNTQLQHAILENNERQARMQKTLDERTPMLKHMEDTVMMNQNIIKNLNRRIDTLEKKLKTP